MGSPIDLELQEFLEKVRDLHPPARDPNDLDAFRVHYETVSQIFPSVHVPVSRGDFKLTLNPTDGRASRQVAARMYLPHGAQTPPLMVWFHGGGWVAGSLDSHDTLCRQTSHDLGLAIACVHLPPVTDTDFLQVCDDAMLALTTLADGRERLSVNPDRLFAAGDGSGAHLALQAAWRLARHRPGTVDAVLSLYPLVKPDFNSMSYLAYANSLTFKRDDAVRAWQSLLLGRFETWDERAVLMHANAPLQRPPAVLILAAECDVAHDDAIALHDWLRAASVQCQFLGAPRMPHDFARLQHVSGNARRLWLDGLKAFASLAKLHQPVPATSA